MPSASAAREGKRRPVATIYKQALVIPKVTVAIAIIYVYKLITCYYAYHCNYSITCKVSKSSNELSASLPFVSVSRDDFYCFNRVSNDLLFVST